MAKRNQGKNKPHDGPGQLYEPDSMFFRVPVGDAKSGDLEYEMTLNVGGNNPIIRSKQTGKWFVLGWSEIIVMAVEAGIDKA